MKPQQVVDECASTNDLARELGRAGAPHGAWVSARRQTAGRGRQGREWISEEGNLFLSLVARISRKELWTWVPLATAVGTVLSLEEIFGGGTDFPIRLKWPNDLWVFRAGRSAKLGGILCEAQTSEPAPFVVAGVGLNCVSSPTGLDQDTVSLAEAFPSAPLEARHADAIRARVAMTITQVLSSLDHDGPDRMVRPVYEKWAAFPAGSRIEWQAPPDHRSATVRGLGPAAELVVEKEGALARLLAEDIRAARLGHLAGPHD